MTRIHVPSRHGRGSINMTTWHDMFLWAYDGVDHTLPGNGGDACVNFLNIGQRLAETIFASLLALGVMFWAYWQFHLPNRKEDNTREPAGKRILLVAMCLTFGTELGFKFATRQMIYILNPCHLVTMLQIFLLAAPPCKVATVVFRLHMHMLAGASIALIFPVVNTRLLPFEACVYWVQHVLIVSVPYYLMRLGGAYTTESLTDFSWPGMSLGILFLYHFLPLQWLAIVTKVNLNNMLCPAISDPFYGSYYRMCAMTHQMILIPTHGKLYTAIAKYFLPKHSQQTTENGCSKSANVAYTTKGDNCLSTGNHIKGDHSDCCSSNSHRQCISAMDRTESHGRDKIHVHTTEDIICNGHMKRE